MLGGVVPDPDLFRRFQELVQHVAGLPYDALAAFSDVKLQSRRFFEAVTLSDVGRRFDGAIRICLAPSPNPGRLVVYRAHALFDVVCFRVRP